MRNSFGKICKTPVLCIGVVEKKELSIYLSNKI